jgi:sugar lactone lactonase YvrE
MIDVRRERIELEIAADVRDKLGEGAFWCPEEQAIYWVDVPMPSCIHRLSYQSGEVRQWSMPEMTMSMAKRSDGTLLVASHYGLNVFDPGDGSLNRILAPEADMPYNRSNDGAPDAKGRFWYGTMCNNIGEDGSYYDLGRATGALWKVESGAPPQMMLNGIGISNGTAFSPDNKIFYFADTAQGTIFAWDFDLDQGRLSNRRVFAAPKGLGDPDGACVDAQGYLWSARWGGGCVVRFNPQGGVDRIIDIPASRVTSCAFGGPQLDRLYVTTSRLHLTTDELVNQPDAGALFSLSPGVAGLPRPQFGG